MDPILVVENLESPSQAPAIVRQDTAIAEEENKEPRPLAFDPLRPPSFESFLEHTNQVYRNMRREMNRSRRQARSRVSYHRLPPLPSLGDLFRFRNRDRPVPSWMRNRNTMWRDTSSQQFQAGAPRPIFAFPDRIPETILEDHQEQDDLDEVDDSDEELYRRHLNGADPISEKSSSQSDSIFDSD